MPGRYQKKKISLLYIHKALFFFLFENYEIVKLLKSTIKLISIYLSFIHDQNLKSTIAITSNRITFKGNRFSEQLTRRHWIPGSTNGKLLNRHHYDRAGSTREASTNRLIELHYTYAITYVITRTLGPRSGPCAVQTMRGTRFVSRGSLEFKW